MKYFSKILSVFLCLLMVFYLLPSSVYATVIDDISNKIQNNSNVEDSEDIRTNGRGLRYR